MIRAEAQAIVDARFVKTGHHVKSSGRCYSSWVETWRRSDGADVTEEDIRAFKALPRGQGHHVEASGPIMVLRCVLDSGD